MSKLRYFVYKCNIILGIRLRPVNIIMRDMTDNEIANLS